MIEKIKHIPRRVVSTKKLKMINKKILKCDFA